MSPKRIFTPDHIRDGISAMGELRQHALDFIPAQVPDPAAPVPTHDGWCVSCKGKKTFEIKNTATMRNKALQHSGECPDCGTKMSAFAKGVQESAA